MKHPLGRLGAPAARATVDAGLPSAGGSGGGLARIFTRAVTPAVTLALALAVGLAVPAAAFERGDTCDLKAPLKVTMKGRAGQVETTLERGAQIEVVSVSDGGISLILSGELKGRVATVDLESACLGHLRSCTLSSPVMMYESNRSDSRSWRVKPGATVSILKKGKTWAAVRVEDLQGFVKSSEITGACARRDDDDDGIGRGQDGDQGHDLGEGGEGGDGPAEAVERGDGPGVLLLPFHLEGAAPAGDADALADDLFARLAFYRPDAGRLGAEGSRDRPWKEQIASSARRARAADTAFVLVGRVAIEPAPVGGRRDDLDRYLLQLAVVDAKSGKVLKAVRAHPTLRPGDTWAELALAALLPSVPAAPGSKLPVVGPKPGFEVAPVKKAEGAKKTEATPSTTWEETPWFANAWGYVSFGVAAVAGAGAGVAGMIALDDNEAANAAAETSPLRSERRNAALAEALTADALTVVAAGAAVTGLVVFVTRAGLE